MMVCSTEKLDCLLRIAVKASNQTDMCGDVVGRLEVAVLYRFLQIAAMFVVVFDLSTV
jgi:hypothetical protein